MMEMTSKMSRSIFKMVKKTHGDKYDYPVGLENIPFSTKICIRCKKCDKMFKCTLSNHIYHKQGCPECKKRNKLEKARDNYICKSQKKHGQKYDYSLVKYTNAKNKVIILCKEHGQFKQSLCAHSRGQGCPKCKIEVLKSRANSQKFFKKAKEKYNNKFDYSESIYENCDSKIKIICPNHGEFWQTPYCHVKYKHGCPTCSGLNKYSQEDFINISKNAQKQHYDYSLVDYKNTYTLVKIICKKHGTFEQAPKEHIKGHGCPKCSNHKSKIEDFVENILSEANISFKKSVRKNKNKVELDFYIKSNNLAIECNGVYWHSELKGKDKNYHLNKTKLCQQESIRLIHVLESEVNNKPKIVTNRLKNILGLNKYKIYARKCEVKEIDAKTKTKFLDKYHIQSNDKASVKLGLYYKTRLVAVMTFCRNRKAMGKTHVEGEWELSRFATIANFSITGGAGKLLKYFERNWQPAKITSYADRRWSEGGLYTKLGFDKVRESKPNYWYFKDVNKLYHRFNFRKSELSKKLETFDPNKTEWDNMVENGWNRIWDCGNLVFEKKYER